jgi:hypothetical protein
LLESKTGRQARKVYHALSLSFSSMYPLCLACHTPCPNTGHPMLSHCRSVYRLSSRVWQCRFLSVFSPIVAQLYNPCWSERAASHLAITILRNRRTRRDLLWPRRGRLYAMSVVETRGEGMRLEATGELSLLSMSRLVVCYPQGLDRSTRMLLRHTTRLAHVPHLDLAVQPHASVQNVPYMMDPCCLIPVHDSSIRPA